METWGWTVLFTVLLAMPVGLPVAGMMTRHDDSALQRLGKMVGGLAFGAVFIWAWAFVFRDGMTITIPLPW